MKNNHIIMLKSYQLDGREAIQLNLSFRQALRFCHLFEVIFNHLEIKRVNEVVFRNKEAELRMESILCAELAVFKHMFYLFKISIN